MNITVRMILNHIPCILMAGLVLASAAACTGNSQAQYNPASDRINSLVGLPPESDIPSGNVIPNLVPVVDASRLAAANLEAGNIKTAARGYLVDHTVLYQLTSETLKPYINGNLKAKYYLNPTTILITRVDSVPDGWMGMVFSLSRQKWIEGTADNTHPDDQDVP